MLPDLLLTEHKYVYRTINLVEIGLCEPCRMHPLTDTIGFLVHLFEKCFSLYLRYSCQCLVSSHSIEPDRIQERGIKDTRSRFGDVSKREPDRFRFILDRNMSVKLHPVTRPTLCRRVSSILSTSTPVL
jgi:hypothetical protein